MTRFAALVLSALIVLNSFMPAHATEETWSGNTEILVGYPGVIAIDDPRLDFEITDDMYVVVYSWPRWNDSSRTNGKITRRTFAPTFDLKAPGHESVVKKGYADWCGHRGPECHTVKIYISDQEFKIVVYPIPADLNTA